MNTKGLRFPFENKHTSQISMPMGGIGAGCICLNGEGGLQDFSIRHRPATTALQDGHVFTDSAFGLLHIKGPKPITRLVEGPMPADKIYAQGLKAQGFRQGGHEGLPRFSESAFASGYPFGRVTLSDSAIPLEAEIIGFNPLIPLDDVNSGIPCAILEYSFRNVSRKPVEYEFSFHLSHLAVGIKEGERGTRTEASKRGVFFFNTDEPSGAKFGSACLMALGGRPLVKGMWFRSGWFDAITQIWREVSTGKFKPNSGHNGIDVEGRNGGSILFKGKLKPGERITHPLTICWHFPNVHYSDGGIQNAAKKKAHAAGKPQWGPFYSSLWKDAREVAEHVRKNYAGLRLRTESFTNALFSSTLPKEVLDAISANLAILKSPTILRQKNGNIWAWEGCFTDAGCCPGSCTHVWNYAQSMPHLFPALERTLREQELLRSLNDEGHVNFRSALPDGPSTHDYHAAADGQLGGIMKLYRDWQISGDTPWMEMLYPHARRSLEYCIRTWDPDRKGALFEPHHNTYDIEFWGPESMCTSIYVGALSAMGRMAGALEKRKDEKTYANLAMQGARFMEENLFNGEYYHQKVQYEELRDQSFVQMLATPANQEGEMLSLFRREGPKYQHGTGCLSDGVIGAWMAKIYGVETLMNRSQIRSTLKAIHQHNFRHDLSLHANCQRPGYALGKEAGLLVCSWPRGKKPALPFVYCDEVFTGIEYQVASHLIEEEFVKEGLELVKAVRSRYDGRTRNPFNEYECGSYYARAMASYALLRSLSGFRYSAVEQTLWIHPRQKLHPFKCFFSTAHAWGTVTLRKKGLTISVIEGSLPLKKINLGVDESSIDLEENTIVKAGNTVEYFIRKARKKGRDLQSVG